MGPGTVLNGRLWAVWGQSLRSQPGSRDRAVVHVLDQVQHQVQDAVAFAGFEVSERSPLRSVDVHRQGSALAIAPGSAGLDCGGVDKPREDVGHVLGPGFPAIMQ